MRRALLNLVTILSTLLLTALVALWIRSYWVHDVYGVVHGEDDPAIARVATVVSTAGVIILSRSTVTYTNPNGAASAGFLRRTLSGRKSVPVPSGPWRFDFPLPGIHHWGTARPDRTSDEWFVTVPYWLVAALAAVLPAWRFRRAWLRRRRAVPGVCRACGYDLRASSGRCPECGTEVPSPGASKKGLGQRGRPL